MQPISSYAPRLATRAGRRARTHGTRQHQHHSLTLAREHRAACAPPQGHARLQSYMAQMLRGCPQSAVAVPALPRAGDSLGGDGAVAVARAPAAAADGAKLLTNRRGLVKLNTRLKNALAGEKRARGMYELFVRQGIAQNAVVEATAGQKRFVGKPLLCCAVRGELGNVHTHPARTTQSPRQVPRRGARVLRHLCRNRVVRGDHPRLGAAIRHQPFAALPPLPGAGHRWWRPAAPCAPLHAHPVLRGLHLLRDVPHAPLRLLRAASAGAPPVPPLFQITLNSRSAPLPPGPLRRLLSPLQRHVCLPPRPTAMLQLPQASPREGPRRSVPAAPAGTHDLLLSDDFWRDGPR